jgi:putative copper resistance protein D
VRSWVGTLLVALLAVASLVPMGTQGHSGDDAFHHEAMMALILHIIGAAVWLGGLLLLVAVRPVLERRRIADVVARYSSIAWPRSCSSPCPARCARPSACRSGPICSPLWRDLGRQGRRARRSRPLRRVVPHAPDRQDARLRRGIPPFWMLIAFELALMGVASGAAAALARTPPPNPAPLPEIPSPAERLTGAPLPPELTIERWVTAWNVDMLWAVLAGFAIFFYLAGVWRLRRRGDAWPVYRTIMWVAGMVLLVWVTGGVVNVYQDYLFSMHMVGHMLLTMAIPVLLVAGAPVTLAARAIRKRDDGTRGGREWILWAVHSPVARMLTNPFVAAALFIGSLWVFYYTDLFRWSLYDHLGTSG